MCLMQSMIKEKSSTTKRGINPLKYKSEVLMSQSFKLMLHLVLQYFRHWHKCKRFKRKLKQQGKRVIRKKITSVCKMQNNHFLRKQNKSKTYQSLFHCSNSVAHVKTPLSASKLTSQRYSIVQTI